MKDIGIENLRQVIGVTSANLENVREFWSNGVRMRHFAYGYAVSVTFSADMVTVSKFLVTSRQYPGVLFPKSPKVLNTAIGYGGLNTVTNNLRHYDFSCLFGPQKGQTRGDIAGVLVTRTSGLLGRVCLGWRLCNSLIVKGYGTFVFACGVQ